MLAQHDTWWFGDGIAQPFERSFFQVAQGFADRELRIDIDALQHAGFGIDGADDQHRAVERGRRRGHVRLRAQTRHQRSPILNAFAGNFGHYIDVRHGAQQAALQLIAESGSHRHGDHQRHDPGRHANDRDHSDHRDHRVLAAGPQVAAGDEQLEVGHSLSSSRMRPISSIGPSGRSSGKRITSRMDRELVRIMVNRSMPMPSPPAGGMP